MGIDSGVFQNSAVRQAELSAEGRAGFKCLFVVHGEGAAALHINDALHRGIPQGQLAAVFHHDADAAEDLHIHQRQVAAVRDVERLRDISLFNLFPGQIITQITIGAALVRAIPYFKVLRHTNALGFILYIAAEVFNGPRFHNIPCVKAIGILFQILGLDLLCQRFLTGIDAEGQGVAARSASLIVLHMNGDQVAARILGRAIQRQVAADGPVNALHAAVLICGHTCHRGVRRNGDIAIFAFQLDLGHIIQFFPIIVGWLRVLRYQCAVNRNRAVLIAACAAGAGTGNAVVILLSDDSCLEAAYELDVQLQRIALTVICNQRGLAICIHHKLHGQILVARSSDGDHIAAFQNRNGRVGTKILRRKLQTVIFGILFVCSAAGNAVVLGFPFRAIDSYLANFAYIACLIKGYIPITLKGILRQFNLTERNFLIAGGRRCNRYNLKRSRNRHILGRHGELAIVHCYGSAACIGHGDRVQLIAVSRSCGNCHGVACLGAGGRYCYSAVCRCFHIYVISVFGWINSGIVLNLCNIIFVVSRFFFGDFQSQVFITIRRNHHGCRKFFNLRCFNLQSIICSIATYIVASAKANSGISIFYSGHLIHPFLIPTAVQCTKTDVEIAWVAALFTICQYCGRIFLGSVRRFAARAAVSGVAGIRTADHFRRRSVNIRIGTCIFRNLNLQILITGGGNHNGCRKAEFCHNFQRLIASIRTGHTANVPDVSIIRPR